MAELEWASDDATGWLFVPLRRFELFRMVLMLPAWLSVSGTRGESHRPRSAHGAQPCVSSHPGTLPETAGCPRYLHLSALPTRNTVLL